MPVSLLVTNNDRASGQTLSSEPSVDIASARERNAAPRPSKRAPSGSRGLPHHGHPGSAAPSFGRSSGAEHPDESSSHLSPHPQSAEIIAAREYLTPCIDATFLVLLYSVRQGPDCRIGVDREEFEDLCFASKEFSASLIGSMFPKPEELVDPALERLLGLGLIAKSPAQDPPTIASGRPGHELYSLTPEGFRAAALIMEDTRELSVTSEKLIVATDVEEKVYTSICNGITPNRKNAKAVRDITYVLLLNENSY